jgi:DNA repair exonuclease SbcCD nuclease subunit
VAEFFISSDLHFDYWRPFSKFLPDGTSTRLHVIRQVLEAGLKRANTDLVIFTGDILHNARRIDAPLAKFVRSYFESLKGKRVIVLPGNHDLRYSFGTTHSLLAPILPDHTEYIAEPRSITIDDVVLHVLPFHPSIDTMRKQLFDFQLKHDRINILLSHFTPNGAKLRDDFSTGDKFGYINPTDLKMFDYAFLGDCHLGNQELDGRIFIPGSPVQHSFGEEDQDKFTYKIAIDSQIKRFKLPSIAPQFKTIYVESDEDIKKVTEVDREKYYLRIISKIPLTNKISTANMVYVENPTPVEFDSNLEYREVVRDYVNQKDPELVPLLMEYL